MRIKYLTLNIWHGHFLDTVIDFIQKENPDIVALQEVYDGIDTNMPKRFKAFSILRDTLGYPHVHHAPAYIDVRPEGKTPEGNAIFSRYPITNTEVVFYDQPFGEYIDVRDNFPFAPRNLQHITLSIADKTINIFNTHGIWGKDGEDSDRRLAMSKTIVGAIQGKTNVILSGDFNLQPHTQTILNIEQHLKNVFKGELTTTFNMNHKKSGGYATAVVDMIFVSPSIKVIDHYCPPVDVSDHLPLVAILEI